MPRGKYYKILGLADGASEDEVRKMYRKLVMKYHPDRNHSEGAEEKFILITEAYEILTGKRNAPVNPARSKRPTRPANTDQEKEQDREQRVREARERYKQQIYREHLENEIYFQKLTKGRKWKLLKITAVVGTLLALFLFADYFLPHHYKEDRASHYHLNYARGLNGASISLIKTEGGEAFWIEGITYDLYASSQDIYIESTWLLHNPINIVSKGKIENKAYRINFNLHRISWLIILFLLAPLFTLWYKRKKISFTVLFYFSYYMVNTLILLFLLTGDRWAHALTLGFL